ncbi:hypothetical protein DFQ30_009798, partial [Apophysomyces sp. BC1015]
MRLESHPLGRLPELADARPERHPKKKREVRQRAALCNHCRGGRRRPGAEKSQCQEHDDEHAIEEFMEPGSIADRLNRAAIEPWQEKQREHRAAHHDHAPEFGFRGGHRNDGKPAPDNRAELFYRAVGLDQAEHAKQPRHDHQHDLEVVGRRPQHRVERGKVPNGCDFCRRHERIGRHKVVRFEEIAPHFWRKEDDRAKDHQKYTDAKEVV